jgi:hypothetical protein
MEIQTLSVADEKESLSSKSVNNVRYDKEFKEQLIAVYNSGIYASAVCA